MRKVITTFYHCSCHDKAFNTPSKAYACERRSKKEKERAAKIEIVNDELRLRLEDPADIWKELSTFAFKHYKWELVFTETKKFTFDNVEEIYCSHNAPIGKPRADRDNEKKIRSKWPGWRFWVKGTINGPSYKKDRFYGGEPSFTSLFRDGFTSVPYIVSGCHTGTFNGGSDFSGEFGMFIEDFPKIKKKYTLWLKDENKRAAQRIKEEEERKRQEEEEKRVLAKNW